MLNEGGEYARVGGLHFLGRVVEKITLQELTSVMSIDDQWARPN